MLIVQTSIFTQPRFYSKLFYSNPTLISTQTPHVCNPMVLSSMQLQKVSVALWFCWL